METTHGAPHAPTIGGEIGELFDIEALHHDTLGGLLVRSVAEHGPARAIVDDRHAVTYAQLGTRTATLARGLAAAGVTKGTRVGVLMPNSSDWLAAAFAVALNGGVIIPISTLATPEERDHILRFSDTSVLLASARSGPRDLMAELTESYPFIAQSSPGAIGNACLPHLRRVFLDGADEPLGAFQPWSTLITLAEVFPQEVVAARAAAVTPFDDAIVYFTSGSTSKPKAVLHMQRGPVTTMRAMAGFQKLTEGEVLLGGKQFFWVGMTSTVGACLASGATYVGMERFAPELAVELIERERVTVVNCSAHQLEQIGRVAETAPRDLRSLRLVEPSRLARAAGLPEGHEYLIGYGMTETAGVVTSLPSDAPPQERQTTNGKPHANVMLRIVDTDTGEPVPHGTTGIVEIGGATVMRGYLKQPPETGFQQGWLRTQDLGRIDGTGFFHFEGRTNGLIKTNGANVSRDEIEAAVRAWGKLDNAFVVGVAHPTLGEAVVLVAVGDESSFPADDLEGHLRSSVAAFKLPKRTIFFAADDIPRTSASDKVNYPELSARVAERLISAEPDSEWAGFLRKGQR